VPSSTRASIGCRPPGRRPPSCVRHSPDEDLPAEDFKTG
jgi:hypothetical protein